MPAGTLPPLRPKNLPRWRWPGWTARASVHTFLRRWCRPAPAPSRSNPGSVVAPVPFTFRIHASGEAGFHPKFRHRRDGGQEKHRKWPPGRVRLQPPLVHRTVPSSLAATYGPVLLHIPQIPPPMRATVLRIATARGRRLGSATGGLRGHEHPGELSCLTRSEPDGDSWGWMGKWVLGGGGADAGDGNKDDEGRTIERVEPPGFQVVADAK